MAGLGTLAPVITPSLFGAAKEATEQVLRGLEAADKLLDALPGERHGPHGPLPDPGPPSHRAFLPAHFRELRKALEQLDPTTHWGGLNEAIRPEDQSIVYLCPAHYEALKYPYRSVVTS